MRSLKLSRQVQSLKALISRTQSATATDIEIQSHWAKYLCILVAGFLENAISDVYADFCTRASSVNVANFASATLSRIKNPKTSRFIEVATTFNRTWGEELKQFVEDDGRKEAINSIMANRHHIAHGRGSNITVARVKEYFEKSIDVIEFIEDQCS